MLVAEGDLAGARRRFEEGLKIAGRLAADNPTSAEAQRDLSISLEKLGSVLVAAGDLTGARNRLEEDLKITKRLAEDSPTSAEAQRDLSLCLEKLGDVLVAAGDLAGARKRFEEALQIAERLAAYNPASAQAQRDLIVCHIKLGGLPGGEHHWSAALHIALALQSQGRLAPRDAWLVDALRAKVSAAENAEP